MNQHALELLEYYKIKERLEDFAVSELGKNMVRNMMPSNDLDRIRNQLIETSEARTIIDKSAAIPIQNLVGIEFVLEKLGKGIALHGEDLTKIMGMLRSTKKIKRFMEERKYIAPTISTYAYSMYELDEIIEEINKCIINNRVDDKASPQLDKIRKKIYIIENRIKNKLEQIVKSPKYKVYLQEAIISNRNGRHVLAVKSMHKKNIDGMVIDKSTTGSTLFIEPATVRNLQNELDAIKIDEEREVYQILLYLTLMVESCEREIKINIETMTYYDFIFAKGKYSRFLKANTVLVNHDGYTKIVKGRHPLLGVEVVPLDFEIGKDYKALLITGPNTGGKTVAIKTVGLFTVMVQSGLHVPVEGGCDFAIYSDVLADIGDGQSIEQSLSTFSAHMKNIIEILNVANKYTLVIIDELGAGTDPAEGEGLAIAVLEELYSKGATIIATSHYSKVKTFVANEEGYENARMSFDINTLQPLYRLIIGEAGESNAFIIALRLGMTRHVIEKAHVITYKEKKDYSYMEKNKTTKGSGYNKVKKPKSLERQKMNINNQSHNEYNIGDVVFVHTLKQRGIVHELVNKKGEIGVMVRNKKILMPIKRVSPFLEAKDLYPEDYDMNIVLKSKDYRKKDKMMSRKYVKDLTIEIEDGKA